MTVGRVLVITGSGISAESGIPTFRGTDGYWRGRNPLEFANPEAFRKDPKTVWEWYSERRAMIGRAEPNAAHRALVDLQNESDDFLLITQNVDNLDKRAGMPAANMVKIHGDIFVTKCRSCGHAEPDAGGHLDAIPACPGCGGPLGPGVVWHGEMLPGSEVRRVDAFLAGGPCDVAMVIGTTAQFGYIPHWAMQARGATGLLIEVNPEPQLSGFADHIVAERASAAMPRLVADILAGHL